MPRKKKTETAPVAEVTAPVAAETVTEAATEDPAEKPVKKPAAILTEQLGITDREMLDALTDKADRLAQHYASEKAEIYTANRDFRMDDFAEDQLVEYKSVGTDGQEYVSGVSVSPSGRAQDMQMKCDYFNEKLGQGHIMFCTGTPYASPYQH